MDLIVFLIIIFMGNGLLKRFQQEKDQAELEKNETKPAETNKTTRTQKTATNPTLESIKEQTRRLADQHAPMGSGEDKQVTNHPQSDKQQPTKPMQDNHTPEPLPGQRNRRPKRNQGKQTTKRQPPASPIVKPEPSFDEIVASKKQSLRQREQRQTLSEDHDDRPFKRDTFYDELMSQSFDDVLEVERTQPTSSSGQKIDARGLRQAIIMKEILDKPVSLREE
ncbi:hypothetical protein HZY86_03355 [Aerococcaceae bacterium DSM 111020]|nr:hypothetical protein [Aerococcaceae bacterium DSM 111020]